MSEDITTDAQTVEYTFTVFGDYLAEILDSASQQASDFFQDDPFTIQEISVTVGRATNIGTVRTTSP